MKGREVELGLVYKMKKIRKLKKIIYKGFDSFLYTLVII